MYKVLAAEISEINLKGANSLYTRDLFTYSMVLFTNNNRVLIDSMRIIYLFVESKEHVVFRFINMNKYCKQNYTKFSESYTQIDLYPTRNIFVVSYYAYFITGDESSKELLEVIEFDMTDCQHIQRFFYFLYTKYRSVSDQPMSRV